MAVTIVFLRILYISLETAKTGPYSQSFPEGLSLYTVPRLGGDARMLWQIISKDILNPSRRQPFWIVAMLTMNGGLNRIAMSIFGRQRDAVEYITGAPGLSKAKPNGDLYGLRITVPAGVFRSLGWGICC